MARPLAWRALFTLLALGMMMNIAHGEGLDLESMGFSSKEADFLKTLGVQTGEDLKFLRQEDLANAPQFSVVEVRRLQYKVGRLNTINRIKRF